jgi:hypothetical protein
LKLFKKVLLLSSIGLFIFSLTQKCYCTDHGCGDSLAVLFSGSFGFFFSAAGLTWLANPFILAAWIFFNKRYYTSLITSAIAAVLSVSFLFFHQIIDTENGTFDQITNYRLGYWLWMASLVTMLFGNLIIYFLEKRIPSIV